MRDPYDVLGVSKTAAHKDIKSAFRKLAKKFHPDQNPDDPKAKERFSEANQAYEILGDEEKRKAFDRGEIDATGKPRFQEFGAGAGGGDPFAGFRRQQRGGPGASHFEFRTSGFDANDIFGEIFGDAFQQGAAGAGQGSRFRQQGGRGGGMPPAPDLNVAMDVSLEDVVSAAKVAAQFPDGRKIAVKLPAYVEDGQTIRLKGQGAQSPFGGEPGDALVKIRFAPHPRYRVEGRDLRVDLPVDLADAVLGAKVAVETPTGKVAVSVPAWSSSGRALRLKGRGLPLKGGGHGDLYAEVQVTLPKDDAELEALMKKRRG
ncbi:MAG: J domain-containing protein [Rhizobiales bacterium]|nr:J domain-containing protein [Hyphomicrobiales bacterium]OJU37330.1 MAG: molecular chaperone DnaJ [Rhizobiales bacterium 68-8]